VSSLQFTEADLEYIHGSFVALEELCRNRGEDVEAVRAEIARHRLPQPAYVLDDGTEMVGRDYFAMADEAGGLASLPTWFKRRYAAAAATQPVALDTPQEEWQAYLSGDYGVCLREVTPETIARKSALVLEIERLLQDPRPMDEGWRTTLRQSVGELDELERPFAPDYDRARWGAVSRDRLINSARRDYPDLFARAPA
jgi:hypothetical protein